MLRFIPGDVTKTKEVGIKLLCHCSNNKGVAGSGVVVSLRKAFPGSMEAYEKWFKDGKHWCFFREEWIPFELGEVQFYQTHINDIIVCNCIGQKTPGQYKMLGGVSVPPVRLWAMKEAMISVADLAHEFIKSGQKTSIIGPEFCGLRAGGDFQKDIVPIIKEVWSDINVIIYQYQEK